MESEIEEDFDDMRKLKKTTTLKTTQLISDENHPDGLVLSQPRDLYASHKQPGPEQAPRWPAECEVICPAVKHIPQTHTRESYYRMSGCEPQPEPWGERYPLVGGFVVYNYEIKSPAPYFTRSCIEGAYQPIRMESIDQPSWYPHEILKKDDPTLDRFSQSNVSKSFESTSQNSVLKDLYNHVGPMVPPDDWYGSTVPPLNFESRFESGNLTKAVQLTASLYELYLRPDLYSQKHASWFYFRVDNMKAGFVYRLSIINMLKSDSLYRDGLRPLMYSERNARVLGIGWQRCGDNITYFKNESLLDGVQTYTLTFTIDFPHGDDVVYFASCYPYTYTDLQNYLSTIQADPHKSKLCKVRLLCRTLAGNCVHVLTITQPQTSSDSVNPDQPPKPAVVLTARVHPSETPSSWAMKGIIDFLTSRSMPAQALREKFVFKIIPMLNPDGVIVGNSRCSLAGKDLNRQYRAASREATPSIWHTKLLIKKLQDEREVLMYCDIHSHGRSHNAFMYGCESKDTNGSQSLLEQVFPLMMHKNTVAKFSFKQCKFVIQKSKEGAGRVVVWTMGIPLSYTLEISIAGSTLGNRRKTHFTISDLEAIGRVFCRTLLDYFSPGPRQVKFILKAVTRLLVAGSNAEEPVPITLSDYSSDEESIPCHHDLENPWRSRQKKRTRRKNDKTVDYLNVARSISKQRAAYLRDSSNSSHSSSRSPSRSPAPTPNVSLRSSPSSSRRHSLCKAADPREILMNLAAKNPKSRKTSTGTKSRSFTHKFTDRGVATVSSGSSPEKWETEDEICKLGKAFLAVSNSDLDSSGELLSVAGIRIKSPSREERFDCSDRECDISIRATVGKARKPRSSKKRQEPFQPDISIFDPLVGSQAPCSSRPSRTPSGDFRIKRKPKTSTKTKSKSGRRVSLPVPTLTKVRPSKSSLVHSESLARTSLHAPVQYLSVQKKKNPQSKQLSYQMSPVLRPKEYVFEGASEAKPKSQKAN